MKAHHKMARHHKAHGGAESPHEGVREYEQDLKDHPKRYNQSHVEDEAEERKHGGRAKRKHGGRIHKHHEAGKHLAHAKHVGHVKGHHGKHHAGKMPRGHKAGGGSNMNPLSSAHKGTQAKGRHAVEID